MQEDLRVVREAVEWYQWQGAQAQQRKLVRVQLRTARTPLCHPLQCWRVLRSQVEAVAAQPALQYSTNLSRVVRAAAAFRASGAQQAGTAGRLQKGLQNYARSCVNRSSLAAPHNPPCSDSKVTHLPCCLRYTSTSFRQVHSSTADISCTGGVSVGQGQGVKFELGLGLWQPGAALVGVWHIEALAQQRLRAPLLAGALRPASLRYSKPHRPKLIH